METDKARMKRGGVQKSSAAAAVRLAICVSLDQIRRDLNQVHTLRRRPHPSQPDSRASYRRTRGSATS